MVVQIEGHKYKNNYGLFDYGIVRDEELCTNHTLPSNYWANKVSKELAREKREHMHTQRFNNFKW